MTTAPNKGHGNTVFASLNYNFKCKQQGYISARFQFRLKLECDGPYGEQVTNGM